MELGFDGDGVLPAVAEIVFLGEASLLAQRLEDRHGLLVDLVLGMFVEAHSLARVADGEGVQVS